MDSITIDFIWFHLILFDFIWFHLTLFDIMLQKEPTQSFLFNNEVEDDYREKIAFALSSSCWVCKIRWCQWRLFFYGDDDDDDGGGGGSGHEWNCLVIPHVVKYLV